jgi:hypothetical protein
MKDFFATCSRAGKFQWESDHAENGGPKYHEPKEDQAIIEPDDQDPFGPDVTGQGTVSPDDCDGQMTDLIDLH